MSSIIENLEAEIAVAKRDIEFHKAVERLRANKDFKLVITTGYFEKEAIRLVHLKADPACEKPETQARIISAMDAIGNLSYFLHSAIKDGELALKVVADNEQTRDEILAEELSK